MNKIVFVLFLLLEACFATTYKGSYSFSTYTKVGVSGDLGINTVDGDGLMGTGCGQRIYRGTPRGN